MARPKLLFFTALEMEAGSVWRAVDASRHLRDEFGLERQVRVHTVGIAACLKDEWQPVLRQAAKEGNVRVIVAGIAGALDPNCRVGDVIVDAPGLDVSSLYLRQGAIFTSRNIVSTARDKATLFSQTGAAAVDMETGLIREVAAGLDLPVVAIRSISDTAETDLDPALMSWVDVRGRPRWGPLALGLMKKPRRVFGLARLGSDTRIALRSLTEALKRLLEAPPRPADRLSSPASNQERSAADADQSD